MARSNKNDYFEMMANMADFSCTAAKKLQEFIATFSPDTIQKGMDEIHEIEHSGDRARHEVMEKLLREFITPIEREDIYEIIQIIDDITDSIDDIPIRLYMLNVQKPAPYFVEMSELVVRVTTALKNAMQELHNYKRSEKLRELIIEINTIESEGDALHIKATHELFANTTLDLEEKLAWREIYECFEACCDLCEHAADAIENTIMKNS